MIDDYLNQSAYRVVKGNHKLYDDTTAATLNLTGSLPSVPAPSSRQSRTGTAQRHERGSSGPALCCVPSGEDSLPEICR